jgi:hypothetical protein
VSTSHDIQRCKWLIEEEEIRAIDERTCERNSLRLPSTQLPGMIVCEMCQTETVEIIRRQFASISNRATMRSGTEGNVVEDGFVSEEQMILEDETDISFADGDEHRRCWIVPSCPVDSDEALVEGKETSQCA